MFVSRTKNDWSLNLFNSLWSDFLMIFWPFRKKNSSSTFLFKCCLDYILFAKWHLPNVSFRFSVWSQLRIKSRGDISKLCFHVSVASCLLIGPSVDIGLSLWIRTGSLVLGLIHTFSTRTCSRWPNVSMVFKPAKHLDKWHFCFSVYE